MAQFKVSFIFSMARNGWSESFYWNAPSAELAECIIDSGRLGLARRAILSRAATIDAIRIHRIGTRNATTIVVTGTGVGAGLPLTNVDDSPWLCWVIRLSDVSGIYNRQYLMRGVPDASWKWDPTYTGYGDLRGPFQDPYLALQRRVQGNVLATDAPNLGAWYIHARTQDRLLREEQPITAVDLTASDPKYFKLTTKLSPAWTVGTPVHISNVKGFGLTGVNGDTVIKQAIDAKTYVVNKQTVAPVELTWNGKGTIYRTDKLAVGPPAVAAFRFERFAKRDTGRPFGVTRGRRRAQKF